MKLLSNYNRAKKNDGRNNIMKWIEEEDMEIEIELDKIDGIVSLIWLLHEEKKENHFKQAIYSL